MRSRARVDRATLNIVSLVIGAVGLVSAFVDPNVSALDANTGTFGANLFAIKREINAEQASIGFAVLAGSMLFLQLIMEVCDWPTQNRGGRTWKHYAGVAVVAAVISVPIYKAVAQWSQSRARSLWFVEAVEGTKASLAKARVVIESKGAVGGPDDRRPTNDEAMRAARLASEGEHLSNIERLFEIAPSGAGLEERLNTLLKVVEGR